MNFIENESKQKLRGGYYTPLDLAVFLAKWVSETNPAKILEPSCGDGIFFEAFASIGNHKAAITGIELEEEEADKASQRAKQILPNSEVINSDFLSWSLKNAHNKNRKYDAIVGNPPFIRYQYLPKFFQEQALNIFTEVGLPFTKHTNSWVSFILASMTMLKPGGRLAMVVPAEIIHIPHAKSLRSYLGKECSRLVVVDPQELWFDNTLQGAVLLMVEKRKSPADKAEGLGIYPVQGRSFLQLNPETVFRAPIPINGKTVEGKWTRALLSAETRALIDKITENPHVHKFKDIADVDVGIVTGANNYFLVTDEVVEKFNLHKWAHPMFGRSEHAPGVIYNSKQHKANSKKGKPTNFIWFPPEDLAKDPTVQAYIEYGESQNLHKRYKTSIRKHWYSVPSVYSTEIGMLKRAHGMPRLIFNEYGAYTTDTAYRIRTNIKPQKLVGSFINSLTALSAELEGRHYGGGVLELVPSEIENLFIPIPDKYNIDLEGLDESVRTKRLEKVLVSQDNKVLGGIGVSKSEQSHLINAWHELRNRRQRISTELVT